ncbi:MAG: AMP-binding protein, partial [Methylophilaceae bacterium]|nr:AMP-binding protein [Methylophilaceae bacterium]
GKPKGVVHSHKSILANINQIMAVYDLKPAEDKLMMVLPLFHAFGFTGSILSILNGIKILIFPSPLQYKRIPEVIYERACTLLISTSTFLNHYATFAQPEYFCQLRIVIAGAEKLNEAVRKTYAEKFGIPILEAYGATECAPGIAVNTHFVNSSGSVGQLLPSMTYKIESVPGIENGGLLHVKGDNVMLGYHLFEHPGVLVPPRDGWYNTGDIVEVDHAGFIYIKGRIKRFAKVAGEMVSLDTIEQIATVAAPEGQHAATSQEDALRGENIVLYTTTSMLKREDLKAAARSLGYPEIAIARKIIFIDEIPVLGTGKKDYNRLKQMAESQPH